MIDPQYRLAFSPFLPPVTVQPTPGTAGGPAPKPPRQPDWLPLLIGVLLLLSVLLLWLVDLPDLF